MHILYTAGHVTKTYVYDISHMCVCIDIHIVREKESERE